MDQIKIWKMLFVVIKFIVSIFGGFFNGLVVLTIHKNLRRLPSSSYLILSIAFSDFIASVVAIPFSIVIHFLGSWPLTLCRAHAFMVFFLGIVTITHLTCFALEKYLTITRSLSKLSYFSKKQTFVVVMACWFYSFCFSLAPLLGLASYGLEGSNDTCSIKWDSSLAKDHIYFILVFLACYLLPIVLITSSYFKILRISKRILKATPRVGGIGETMAQALMRKHRRGALYFLSVIAVFLMSWTPYAIISVLVIFKGVNLFPLALSACGVFAKMSFMLNPIMYFAFSHNFRLLVKRTFCICDRLDSNSEGKKR
ncbi:melanopsin-B-like [Acropora muricata]|uniref:melanopsin-B-like n=1 Tax=Acropora muricata TaxID=159855 RepID=UPI0034E3793C